MKPMLHETFPAKLEQADTLTVYWCEMHYGLYSLKRKEPCCMKQTAIYFDSQGWGSCRLMGPLLREIDLYGYEVGSNIAYAGVLHVMSQRIGSDGSRWSKEIGEPCDEGNLMVLCSSWDSEKNLKSLIAAHKWALNIAGTDKTVKDFKP